MKTQSVYVETSVISYLANRPSHDLLTAACQQATQDWWEEHRAQYELFTSQLVVAEARAGNPVMRSWRPVTMKNEILEEVWRNRDEFARQYSYDIDAMVVALQEMEHHPLTRLVDRRKGAPNKRIQPKRQGQVFFLVVNALISLWPCNSLRLYSA